jgi:hypothetical protein
MDMRLFALASVLALAAVTSACKKEPAPSAPGTPTAVKPMTPAGPAGPTATGKGYKVEGKVASAEAKAGDKVDLVVTITPKDGMHLNQEYETLATVAVAAPGAAAPEATTTLGKDKATTFGEQTAVFTVPYVAKAAGEHKVTARIDFAVCTETTCDPQLVELAWSATVK